MTDHAASLSLDDIKSAAEVLKGTVVRTPTVHSPILSEMSGANVFVKLENQQYTGSFKNRGARVKMAQLSDDERKAGVIAASAGNHAQGVAYHARDLNIPATIVMPKATPFTKIARTEALGAKVVLHGEGFWAADDHAQQLAMTQGMVYVHPYDDVAVMAGQGTVGLEMLEDTPELDAVIVPIGGGGLISGMAVALKALKPEIDVYGVQSDQYPSMQALMRGLPLPTSSEQTLADGIAVKTPGANTRQICIPLLKDILDVDEDEIERSIQILLEKQRTVSEGAGAAGLAGLLKNKDLFQDKNVGLIVSGGNIDSRVLSSVLMRGLVREGRLVRLRIKIIDVPGVLAIVSKIIGDAGANIIEVHHQRLLFDVPIKQTELDVAMETLDMKHVQHIIGELEKVGFQARMLSGMSDSDR